MTERNREVTGSKRLPFQIIVIDMSRAITNAVLQEMCGMTIINYLHWCITAKKAGKVSLPLVAWCYAHFTHGNAKNAKKWVPLNADKKFSPARKLVRFSMAAMARTEMLEKAIEMFTFFVQVVSSTHYTEDVKISLRSLAIW